MSDDIYGVATGPTPTKLKIVGRPAQGITEKVVVLEEPDEPVQMHWMKSRRILLPHFRVNCSNCEEGEEPRAFYYLGCVTEASRELAILELTSTCFGNLVAGAVTLPNGEGSNTLRAVMVNIFRGRATLAQRVLRVETRLVRVPEWPYHTRRELARIWGIPVKPRIYKEA